MFLAEWPEAAAGETKRIKQLQVLARDLFGTQHVSMSEANEMNG